MALVVGTNSYIDLTDAETYFLHKIHAADWDAATDPTKTDALVSATAMLDRQQWIGAQTAPKPGQALDWPRTGVTDEEGTAVASDAVPQFMKDATCELALALIQDLTVQSNADTGSNIKALKAGSAEIHYFKGTDGSRFPTIIHEIIGHYLLNSAAYTSPYYGATEAETGLTDHDLSRGY